MAKEEWPYDKHETSTPYAFETRRCKLNPKNTEEKLMGGKTNMREREDIYSPKAVEKINNGELFHVQRNNQNPRLEWR